MNSGETPNIRHHLQLPSGERLDVVYGGHRQFSQDATRIGQLHTCFHCASELVYPLDWSEEGPKQWRVLLRCPECEATREGVFEQEDVERLDDELDRGTGALLGDLKCITHANMTDEIEFFIRALDADLIVPNDFQQ